MVLARRWLTNDLAAIVAACALACFAAWDLLRDGTPLGMDTATAFYPWYSFLGDRLRSGHLPLWNPQQFSGAPFAADPESGWMYLPAMTLFALLPVPAAANAYLVGHLLVAGLAVYALGRMVGMSPGGALVAATSYTYSGFFFGHNVCCFAYSSVATWLPVSLVGVECAIGARTWRRRVLGWGLAGFALSQILAMWLGQGAYYALLVVGGYVVYRALFATTVNIRSRLRLLALHGSAVLLVGFGLGAAAVLPRMEYNALSNLPGGYPSSTSPQASPGWLDWGIIEDWQVRLLEPGFHYVGWVVLALALAAPLLARLRMGVPFFAALSVAVLILARFTPTPLHALFDVLPAFEQTHAHAPERALIVFFLGPALLAGATASALAAHKRLPGGLTIALIVLAVLVDLRLAWHKQLVESFDASGAYELKSVDLTAYYAPTAASQFLESVGEPWTFRYLGYAGHVFGGPIAYTLGWSNPKTVALEVNSRGLVTGLHDVQGYNPIHLARYDHYMRALNGRDQEYHHLDVFEAGLDSPLLDLLGTRYVIVPRTPAADQIVPRLKRPMPSVYEDGDVQILENRAALPRAWIVHAAYQAPRNEALEMLASGAVNPRDTALLEEPPPPLGPPDHSSARVDRYDADGMNLLTSTATPGLLVLSEIYDPAWKAYVDDLSMHVYVADGALRAIALPAGDHRVELRYEPTALGIGVTLSLTTLVLLVLMIAWRGPRRSALDAV